jgi:uncharacterized lipoprotein YmbA
VRFRALALAIVVTAGGCARTPAVRYYTIPGAESAWAESAQRPRYTVRVAAPTVPDVLDRPELVLRLSPTEVAVDDGHHWAEPLPSAVGRAVSADLAHALAGAHVTFADDLDGRDPADVELYLEVRRFDLELGRQVDLEIVWAALWTDGRWRAGRAFARAAALGAGYDALAASCAKALAAVTDDIARGLRS